MPRAGVRLGILLVGLLGSLPVGAPAARADEGEPVHVPPGSAVAVGFPPLGPVDPREAAAVRAWCTAAVALGQRYAAQAALADRRHGGDLLFSAAVALRRYARAPGEAAAQFSDAVDAYPPGDPTAGIAVVHWAELEAGRGNMPRVERLLERLEDWAGARAPRDLDATEAWRWDGLAGALRERLPAVRATWHEAHGRFGAAAVQLELLARTDVPGRAASLPCHLWERAARLRYRAADAPAALHAIDRALALEHDDARLAGLRFWRLQAAHGLLRPDDASPGVTAQWPGPTYDRDVHTYLRSIQGVAGVGTKYFALGSSAFMAQRYETALSIYRLALADPALVARARRAPLIWRGFLLAYEAALALERFDEAERLLAVIERIADEPIEEKDAFLLAIRRGREAKRRREARARAEREGRLDGDGARPRRKRLGGIETGEEADRRGATGAPTTREGPPPSRPWALGAVLLLGGLLLGGLLLQRRLRRRRRVAGGGVNGGGVNGGGVASRR